MSPGCRLNIKIPSYQYRDSHVKATHIRTGSLVIQVMAIHQFNTNSLPEPMLPYCQLIPWKQTSLKYQSKYKKKFFQVNACEDVCKMPTILFRPQSVACSQMTISRLLVGVLQQTSSHVSINTTGIILLGGWFLGNIWHSARPHPNYILVNMIGGTLDDSGN